LDLAAGSSGTFDAGASNLFCGATINNAGTWTMLSGNLLQNNPPSLFNNLPGATINLNGWANPTSPWSMNLNNQGTVNKSIGAVRFTLGGAPTSGSVACWSTP
jgi:hypothetical protein